MAEINLAELDVRSLLRLFADIGDELVTRQISRSASNPTADYAQRLFRDALKLTWSPFVTKGYNATDEDGGKYKIRSRRITSTSGANVRVKESKDISVDEFDWFALVVFSSSFEVSRTSLIPKQLVRLMAKTVEKGYELELEDDDWARDGVRDVTRELQSIQNSIE